MGEELSAGGLEAPAAAPYDSGGAVFHPLAHAVVEVAS
jgi:hypothetical protein